MNNVCLSIIVSIISSLIATIIWILVSQLYSFTARRRINYILELMIDSVRQFEHSVEFLDYQTASAQADNILEYISKIYDNIKPLIYSRSKKKLIYTYLYQCYYILYLFKNKHIGYSGNQELEARCESFKGDCLYTVSNGKVSDCWFHLVVDIITELNKSHSIRKVLKGFHFINHTSSEGKINFYKNLINNKTFRYGKTTRYSMKSQVYTRKKYFKLLNRKTGLVIGMDSNV